ncbi:MAG: response regulator [Anaerolineales bacterium]
MPDKDKFTAHVATAYSHLYDIVALRTSPLITLLIEDSAQTPTEKAWTLHHRLIDAIETLDPGPDAPTSCYAWRRHRVMMLHHLEGLTPEAVADRLAISRRTYYRAYNEAVQSIATLLWDKYVGSSSVVNEEKGKRAEPSDLDRMELLRLSAAQAAESERYAPISEVIDGAIALAQDLAEERDVRISVDAPPSSPTAMVEKNAARQILLEILDFLLGSMRGGRLEISYDLVENDVELFLTSTCPDTIPHLTRQRKTEIKVLRELAQAQRIEMNLLDEEEHIRGFHLRLPSKRLTTVLLVDDNEEMLALLERYLLPHNYGVLKAQSGSEALALARSRQPDGVILDLMMPDQDGWDVLQTLSNQPATEQIPVMVCTVLSARRLALSLGATVFLEKPITEDKLLSALESIHHELPAKDK